MIRRTTWWVVAGWLAAVTPILAAEPSSTSDASPTSDVNQVLARESMKLDSLLSPESRIPDRPELDTRISALDGGNFDSLGVPFRGRGGFSLAVAPGRWSMFNRVEGARVSSGLDVRIARGLRFKGDAGYAIAAHRWVGQAVLTAGGRRTGTMIRLEAFDRMKTFGPDPVATGSAFLALLAGQDRQDYLRRRQAGLWLTPIRSREGELKIGAWLREDRSAEAVTDDHLLGGGTPMEQPNPVVDEVKHNGLTAAGDWRLGGDLMSLRAEAEMCMANSKASDDFAAQEIGITIRPILPGGTLSLSLDGQNTAGSPPIQEEPYLGGDGNLRGYERLEFTGRRRLSARIEYELGLDLLKRARIPLLELLHLQFIPFVDIGTTWGEGRGASSTRLPSLDGASRTSIGLGLRRDVWLPGVRAIRLDVIRRTDGDDDPTRFWFRLIPY
ncbi:MAG: hypothetical protein SGI90_06210 [Candidatus Eisenbacteria bacterium]|nr:hypothetical protein [Candidatus Eisenbacteria bacterium]